VASTLARRWANCENPVNRRASTARARKSKSGAEDYRRAAKSLRKAADRLAATRDARVTLRAFENLAGKKTWRFSKIKKALQKNCRREARRFAKDNSVAAAERTLRKVNRHLAGLKIGAADWAAVEPGLRQSYRRGRQCCETARREPSPENLHVWRKHVKNFWYQLRLLCPAWPAAACVQTDDWERLGELLGDAHDLVLLQQFVAEHRAKAAREAVALEALNAARQKKLRAGALALGKRLYAETPAVVCRRLGRHWRAWHDRH
jgi:CHAD domain-containing protein